MNERLFTASHAAALAKFHDETQAFGHIGFLWAPAVLGYMEEYGCDSLLDYGAGKGTMGVQCRALAAKKGFPLLMQEYDPATFPGTPAPADMVTCIDVLEHVETECLEAVIDDLRRCMGRVALVTVSLRNRSGRNAHLHPNVMPREVWMAMLQLRLGNVTEIGVIDSTKAKSELAVLVRPHDKIDF